MNLSVFCVILAMGQPPGGQNGGGSTAPMLLQLFPIILVFGVFYFALIRPQQKKEKERLESLKTLKPGDKVIASGGIIGVVVGVKEKSVSIRSSETKLEILKTAVSEITERAGVGGET